MSSWVLGYDTCDHSCEQSLPSPVFCAYSQTVFSKFPISRYLPAGINGLGAMHLLFINVHTMLPQCLREPSQPEAEREKCIVCALTPNLPRLSLLSLKMALVFMHRKEKRTEEKREKKEEEDKSKKVTWYRSRRDIVISNSD